MYFNVKYGGESANLPHGKVRCFLTYLWVMDIGQRVFCLAIYTWSSLLQQCMWFLEDLIGLMQGC
jgi:hypothetical protein